MKISCSVFCLCFGHVVGVVTCSVSSTRAVLGDRWTERFHEFFFCVDC